MLLESSSKARREVVREKVGEEEEVEMKEDGRWRIERGTSSLCSGQAVEPALYKSKIRQNVQTTNKIRERSWLSASSFLHAHSKEQVDRNHNKSSPECSENLLTKRNVVINMTPLVENCIGC